MSHFTFQSFSVFICKTELSSTTLLGLWLGLNERTHRKYLEQSLCHCQVSVNGGYDYSITVISCKKGLVTGKGTSNGVEGARRSLISDPTRDVGLSPGDSGT